MNLLHESDELSNHRTIISICLNESDELCNYRTIISICLNESDELSNHRTIISICYMNLMNCVIIELLYQFV